MNIELTQEAGEEINLTPLIDCVFLMLIFFMVTTTFNKPDEQPIKELFINLPQAASGIESEGLSTPEIISIDSRGRYYLNDEKTSITQLHERLKLIAQTTPEKRIRIDGDKHAEYQYVAHILNLCQFVGLHNIGTRMR